MVTYPMVADQVLALLSYTSPAVRVIYVNLGLSFLQSNLEPIGGGDDPDIDW